MHIVSAGTESHRRVFRSPNLDGSAVFDPAIPEWPAGEKPWALRQVGFSATLGDTMQLGHPARERERHSIRLFRCTERLSAFVSTNGQYAETHRRLHRFSAGTLSSPLKLQHARRVIPERIHVFFFWETAFLRMALWWVCDANAYPSVGPGWK